MTKQEIAAKVSFLKLQREELSEAGHFKGKSRQLRKINIKLRNQIKRQRYLSAQ